MKKIIILITLLTASAYISGCRSASAKTGSEAAKTAVVHDIKYSNKGTRSEGRSGYLKINGEFLPDCFRTVVADGKVYSFHTKNTTWGNDGYFPAESESAESVYPPVSKTMSDADLAKGWSEVNGRCRNVPSHWIFVRWENGSAALSPDKINEFVKVKSLKIIIRNSMFSGIILN